MRWIVVGTDFSEAADGALEYAVNLGIDLRGSVACVHAYEDAPGALASSEDPTPRLHAQLADAVARSGAEGKGVHVEPIVRRGPPWDKLLNVGAEMGADLIVVGAQGQRASPSGFFLGSVTARLAATSTRPVLVVPARFDPSRLR